MPSSNPNALHNHHVMLAKQVCLLDHVQDSNY